MFAFVILVTIKSPRELRKMVPTRTLVMLSMLRNNDTNCFIYFLSLPPSVHLKPHCRFFCAPQVSHCVHFHLIIEPFCLFGITVVFFPTSPGSSDDPPRDVCQTSNWFTQTRTHKHTTRNLQGSLLAKSKLPPRTSTAMPPNCERISLAPLRPRPVQYNTARSPAVAF